MTRGASKTHRVGISERGPCTRDEFVKIGRGAGKQASQNQRRQLNAQGWHKWVRPTSRVGMSGRSHCRRDEFVKIVVIAGKQDSRDQGHQQNTRFTISVTKGHGHQSPFTGRSYNNTWAARPGHGSHVLKTHAYAKLHGRICVS